MFGAKLVNPAQIYGELSCEQVKFTDVQTDRLGQRQYPFGLKGQEAKIGEKKGLILNKSPTNQKQVAVYC